MPNKKYQQGYRFELKVKKYVDDCGTTYKLRTPYCLLIQCKISGKISRKEWDQVLEVYEKTDGIPLMARNNSGTIEFVDMIDTAYIGKFKKEYFWEV